MNLRAIGWRRRITVKGATWHLAMTDNDSACGRYRDLDESATLRTSQLTGNVCKSCLRILEGPD